MTRHPFLPVLALSLIFGSLSHAAILTESEGALSTSRCNAKTNGNIDGIAELSMRTHDTTISYPGGSYVKQVESPELRISKAGPQEPGGPGQTWFKRYRYLGQWFPNMVDQTLDGGFLISGYALENVGPSVYYERPVLVRVDSIGSVSWTRLFQNESGDRINAFVATLDSGFLLAGQEGPYDSTRAAVLKLDKNGFGQWTRFYGGDYGIIHHAQATPDGGFLLAGTTRDTASSTGWDDLVVKTDSLGNSIWSRTFPGSGEDILYSADAAPDGGYILAGSTTSLSGQGGINVQVLKLDGSGNLQWIKEFGTTGRDWANGIKSLDGGFVFVAQMYRTMPYNNNEVRLWKLDAAGNSLWNKHFDGDLDPDLYQLKSQSILAHAPGQFTFHTSRGSVRVFDTDYSAPRMKVTGSVDPVAQTATLQAEGLGTNLSYQWKKDGIAIPGATTATLSYGPAPDAATGNYSCVVSNPNGSAEPVFIP